jgi:hypothetical protein
VTKCQSPRQMRRQARLLALKQRFKPQNNSSVHDTECVKEMVDVTIGFKKRSNSGEYCDNVQVVAFLIEESWLFSKPFPLSSSQNSRQVSEPESETQSAKLYLRPTRPSHVVPDGGIRLMMMP